MTFAKLDAQEQKRLQLIVDKEKKLKAAEKEQQSVQHKGKKLLRRQQKYHRLFKVYERLLGVSLSFQHLVPLEPQQGHSRVH